MQEATGPFLIALRAETDAALQETIKMRELTDKEEVLEGKIQSLEEDLCALEGHPAASPVVLIESREEEKEGISTSKPGQWLCRK